MSDLRWIVFDMMRIAHMLAATDLTTRSELAIQRALQLREQLHATLTVLHVVEPDLMDDLARHRRNDAESFLSQWIAKLPEKMRTHCSCRVVVGDAFGAITSQAEAQQAGLIVLGEPGKYRYANLFVGTTTERVVRASPIPVLIVKAAARQEYRRVLVPFDLSEAAIRALMTGLTIAPLAEVRIVHAWRPPLASLDPLHAMPDAIRKENEAIRSLIKRKVAGAVADSAAQGRVLNIDMIEDNPYAVLRSEYGWPELLAMGTHARGRLATAMIGSLALRVLAEAPCDVLVARP
jgi:nucleotide-binding universal stress UspA family protein